MKNPAFNPNEPVFFMAATDRMSITVPGEKAHAKRRYFAEIAMPVTTWQGSRRVAVPYYPN